MAKVRVVLPSPARPVITAPPGDHGGGQLGHTHYPGPPAATWPPSRILNGY
jgi:hypothetical protein